MVAKLVDFIAHVTTDESLEPLLYERSPQRASFGGIAAAEREILQQSPSLTRNECIGTLQWQFDVCVGGTRAPGVTQLHSRQLHLAPVGAGEEVLSAGCRPVLERGTMRHNAARHDERADLIEVPAGNRLDGRIQVVGVDAGRQPLQLPLPSQPLQAPGLGPVIAGELQHVAVLHIRKA
ncbi:hypothetical protein [Peristeroidobacter soli]|uniref:hypothetical protein n=1 Tax=Peristeroidobacter soli TaxID=2497877 RepID=UPI00101CBA30|nr:hypothetical protein [Peristeroidobacter soli]